MTYITSTEETDYKTASLHGVGQTIPYAGELSGGPTPKAPKIDKSLGELDISIHYLADRLLLLKERLVRITTFEPTLNKEQDTKSPEIIQIADIITDRAIKLHTIGYEVDKIISSLDL